MVSHDCKVADAVLSHAMSVILHPKGGALFSLSGRNDMQMYTPLTNAADPETPLLLSPLANREQGPKARHKDTSINMAFLKV